jgi:hypothetical protein
MHGMNDWKSKERVDDEGIEIRKSLEPLSSLTMLGTIDSYDRLCRYDETKRKNSWD